MECAKDCNTKRCICSFPGCERKGKCCECLKYHLERKELPACCFPKDVEENYDRSFELFCQLNNK